MQAKRIELTLTPVGNGEVVPYDFARIIKRIDTTLDRGETQGELPRYEVSGEGGVTAFAVKWRVVNTNAGGTWSNPIDGREQGSKPTNEVNGDEKE